MISLGSFYEAHASKLAVQKFRIVVLTSTAFVFIFEI